MSTSVFRYRGNRTVQWYAKKLEDSNYCCLYCGTYVGPGSATLSNKEHLIGRNFVPSGSLDGPGFNFIFRTCLACNSRKADAERHVSSVTLFNSPGRAEDPAVDAMAKRKASKDFHPRIKGTLVQDASTNHTITWKLTNAKISFNVVAPPQLDTSAVALLAFHQVQALFTLVTSTNPQVPAETRLLPSRNWHEYGSFGKGDWGNPQLRRVCDRAAEWPAKVRVIAANGYFKAVLRRSQNGTGKSSRCRPKKTPCSLLAATTGDRGEQCYDACSWQHCCRKSAKERTHLVVSAGKGSRRLSCIGPAEEGRPRRMRRTRTTAMPWLPEVRSSGMNAANIGTLVVSFASVVVSAVGRDAPRWAFFIPLASLLVFLGVLFGPPVWSWRQSRRVSKSQRDYLHARWPRFHGLAEEFAGFFGPNKTWSVYTLAVGLHSLAPEFSQRVSFMNVFTNGVERSARITPRDIVEAQHLMHGLWSAINLFEGRGTLALFRQLELKPVEAELREKFLEAYSRFKGRYAELDADTNRDLGVHVLGELSV